jgi:ribosomal-protein-alanine N-acetyltransferase
MDLRAMSESDLPAVVTAERELHPTPWTEAQFRDSMRAGHALAVAEVDEAMIGYGVTMQVLDEAHLLNLSIFRSRQRKGYGRQLLGALMANARLTGATRMFLEVRAGNAPAISLYGATGFAEIGRRKGYYGGGEGQAREDAIVMAATLGREA